MSTKCGVSRDSKKWPNNDHLALKFSVLPKKGKLRFENYISAILQSIIKDRKSDGNGIMVKLYELYPHLCSTITKCPDQLTEPIGHVLLAYHPFLSCD